MLLEELIVCAFIGMVTAGAISLLVTKGKADAIVLVMVLFGATIGWIVGMIFIFTTGGLELTVEWFVLPVLTTAFFSFFILRYYRDIKFIKFSRKTRTNRAVLLISIIIVVALLGSVFALMLPKTYASSYNTTSFLNEQGRQLSSTRTYTVSHSDAQDFSTSFSGIVSIRTAKSSVSFPRISENPTAGDYLAFQATFSVVATGGHWTQPYIAMAVIFDTDDSGGITSGDEYWYSNHYKIGTGTQKYWRTNLLWDSSGQPLIQVSAMTVDGELLMAPIFHANTITQWQNDNGKIFSNTPELYTSPYDQLSWEYTGGSITLKEDITSFATISAGSSENIKGKIYCPSDYVGRNFLLVHAFDMRYTDPFTPGETPLSQKTMTFIIESDGEPYCGDGNCDPGETYDNCPEDCDPDDPVCGDGTCDPGENQYNCPEDCGYPDQPVIGIDITSYIVLGLLGIGTISGIVYLPRVLVRKPPKI